MSNDVQDWLNGFYELNPDAIQEDEVVEKKAYKIDMFGSVLPAVDKQDRFYYRNLPEEQKDALEPWMVMRWLASSASDKEQPHYLLSLNDFVNSNFSMLSPQKAQGRKGHKELQWMLLTLCGTGKHPHRKFIKPGKGAIKNKLETALLVHYPLLKDDELALLMSINTKEELIEFFRENGYDDKSIKEIMKADARSK
jgi:hypothetical protein